MDGPAIGEILSGRRQGAIAGALRGVLGCAEPFYAAAMRLRNRMYETGFVATYRLPVPVVSIGNITAGGTGKTPTVRWLAGRLREQGMRPAILLRGYKRSGLASDEELVLREGLVQRAGWSIVVHAEPDRVAGGMRVLKDDTSIDVILLDDGFQHRRLARDFDLVLIDATEPFGYGHVHPRGLLREPIGGLERADAFVLTRSDQVTPERRSEIEQVLRALSPKAPTYRAAHVLTGLRSAVSQASAAPDVPLATLATRRFFAAAGIGSPHTLERQLEHLPGEYRGRRWFRDHHDYTPADLKAIQDEAASAGANVILVTEKDWVKLRRLKGAPESPIPIWRLEVEMQFDPKAGEGLISLIRARIEAEREKARS